MGHTTPVPGSGLPPTVHPHIRGAYSASIQDIQTGNGSSPHTWGIPSISAFIICGFRFIPTYVGHTMIETGNFNKSPVHPHIRGAYKLCVGFHPPGRGSSPHTWGIPGVPKRKSRKVRFIPTYVGHTTSSGRPESIKTVHPHIRGAYIVGAFDLQISIRFIPTYVGHTLDRRKKNGWFQPLLL